METSDEISDISYQESGNHDASRLLVSWSLVAELWSLPSDIW